MANWYSNNFSVIDTASNNVTATVNVGNTPYGVAMNLEGTKVYVSHMGKSFNGTVSIIDTSTNNVTANVPVKIQPRGIAVSQDGKKVYVAIWDHTLIGGTVSVIDINTNKVTNTVNVGVTTPYGIAVSPDGTKIYVIEGFAPFIDTSKGFVSVIDTGLNRVVARWMYGSHGGIAVNPAGTKVYVTNSESNSVSAINIANNTVNATTIGGYSIAFGQFYRKANKVTQS